MLAQLTSEITGSNEDAVSDSRPGYAVFGNPIKHSKSPTIHAAFAEQTNDKLIYRAVRVELDNFESRVRSFFAAGGLGLNITLPFKARAIAMADECTDRASAAGAANWLMPLEQGGIRADNTDGVGMVRDMVANQGWTLAGRRTLIMGAGGAVRGVLQPLLNEGPGSVVIANRTTERAERLAKDCRGDSNIDVSGCGYEALEGQTFDLIINGTSAGLSGELPPLPSIELSHRCCCYDMVYAAEPTVFMRWSAAQAAWAVTDGLGMLVEQAAESFYLWRGKRPDTAAVIHDLRHLLSH